MRPETLPVVDAAHEVRVRCDLEQVRCQLDGPVLVVGSVNDVTEQIAGMDATKLAADFLVVLIDEHTHDSFIVWNACLDARLLPDGAVLVLAGSGDGDLEPYAAQER